MNCESFIELTVVEKAELLGKLIIATQTDPDAFRAANRIVNRCKKKGVYDRVDVNLDNVHMEMKDIDSKIE